VKKEYLVGVSQLYHKFIKVTASSEDEAIHNVFLGRGELDMICYVRDLTNEEDGWWVGDA